MIRSTTGAASRLTISAADEVPKRTTRPFS
jgi:hypothetical protein